MIRRPKYGSKDNPQFEDGDVVEVDTFYFGVPAEDAEYVEGVIVGKHELGNSNPTQWIVDFGDKDWFPNQQYRAMVVSPCAICKLEAVEESDDEDDKFKKDCEIFDELVDKWEVKLIEDDLI
jgi:hypothetical protein